MCAAMCACISAESFLFFDIQVAQRNTIQNCSKFVMIIYNINDKHAGCVVMEGVW